MAFVYKSQRRSSDLPRAHLPGPGQYSASSTRTNHGYAPFLSTTAKSSSVEKKAKPMMPGPGAYNLPSSFEIANKEQKVRYATLNPKTAVAESANQLTIFKSKVQRFMEAEKEVTPGPGSYSFNEDTKQRRNSYSHTNRSCVNPEIEKTIEMSRKCIPSIPSHTNSYGYSEIDRNNVIANRNPLEELQKYVGPGYYQTQDLFAQKKAAGVAWYKYNTRRFETPGMKKATGPKLGPGAYGAEGDITAALKYKNKPTVAFASNATREQKGPSRIRHKSVQHQLGRHSFSEGGAVQDTSNFAIEQIKAEDLELLQEIRDSAPGPGHYYNERASAAIKPVFKPPRLQFFGSSTDRFKATPGATSVVGPGEYDGRHKSAPPKKTGKYTAFLIGDHRFEKNIYEKMPGPGAYEAKPELMDKVREKQKSGYVGNFGTTERRFKREKTAASDKVGPGAYNIDIPDLDKNELGYSHRETQTFRSKVQRVVVNMKKDEIPPPGTYNQGYYDLSKKISKDVKDSDKKAPFNTSSLRFKERLAEEIDLEQEAEGKKRIVTIEDRIRNKMSAVFLSQTRKGHQVQIKEDVPGPGYYRREGDGGWIKRTYNIGFLGE